MSCGNSQPPLGRREAAFGPGGLRHQMGRLEALLIRSGKPEGQSAGEARTRHQPLIVQCPCKKEVREWIRWICGDQRPRDSLGGCRVPGPDGPDPGRPRLGNGHLARIAPRLGRRCCQNQRGNKSE